jgi:hypothetical protein
MGPEKTIPDSGVKKAPDPGSATLICTQKFVFKPSKIWVWDPGSGKSYSGSHIQGQKGTGSRYRYTCDRTKRNLVLKENLQHYSMKKNYGTDETCLHRFITMKKAINTAYSTYYDKAIPLQYSTQFFFNRRKNSWTQFGKTSEARVTLGRHDLPFLQTETPASLKINHENGYYNI